eukprot:GFYU01011535.1.p1 GENE.GFYU01011535.1~~GFYU01011535.1.p1  ORF type:complete len:181 (+),score=41.60 GFYU01011535.1:261-803(+)
MNQKQEVNYAHNFVPDEEMDVCLFCGKKKEEHQVYNQTKSGKKKKIAKKKDDKDDQDKSVPDTNLLITGKKIGGADKSLVPVNVADFSHQIVRQMAAGKGHSMILTDNGMLYTWGISTFGQLGLGDQKSRSAPTLVVFFQNLRKKAGVIQIDCGAEHSVALTCTYDSITSQTLVTTSTQN